MPFVSVREVCVLFSELVSRHLIWNTSDWDHDLLLRRLFPVLRKTNRSKVHHVSRCHMPKPLRVEPGYKITLNTWQKLPNRLQAQKQNRNS